MNIQRPFLVEFMKYRVLNKNREFTRLYARGKSYVHPHLVLYVAKNRLGVTRVGLTATKKVGGAVQRNHIKRLLRESIRPKIPQLKCGYYVWIARSGAVGADFHRMERSVDNLLTRQRLYKAQTMDEKGKK